MSNVEVDKFVNGLGWDLSQPPPIISGDHRVLSDHELTRRSWVDGLDPDELRAKIAEFSEGAELPTRHRLVQKRAAIFFLSREVFVAEAGDALAGAVDLTEFARYSRALSNSSNVGRIVGGLRHNYSKSFSEIKEPHPGIERLLLRGLVRFGFGREDVEKHKAVNCFGLIINKAMQPPSIFDNLENTHQFIEAARNQDVILDYEQIAEFLSSRLAQLNKRKAGQSGRIAEPIA